MEPILDILTVQHLALAAFVAVGAGMVKGIVGFAMPMIFVFRAQHLFGTRVGVGWLDTANALHKCDPSP